MQAHALKPAVVSDQFHDLMKLEPRRGLIKALGLLTLLVVLSVISLTVPSWTAMILWTLAVGVVYAPALFLTHDAIHHTLTGWVTFDELYARLVAYSVLWPHGAYKEIHFLHHKMNARDTHDPERVEPTQAEYEKAGPVGKWAIRNQWVLNIFVYGGFGIIGKTFAAGFSFARLYPRIYRQLAIDILGIVAINIAMVWPLTVMGLGDRFMLWFILTERIVGGLMQLRSHIEHYGLWPRSEQNWLYAQIVGCRNLRTSRLVSWYFNGLNFHSAHHAFPKIPYYRLEDATLRMKELAPQTLPPMTEDTGYFKTALRLSRQLSLINNR